MHPTKTLDQWKKYNAHCRNNPALARKINSDPFVILLLALMSSYLEKIPDAPVNIVKQLSTVAPMPKALYFGEPCPFHVGRVMKPNEWLVAFQRALGWFDTGVSFVLDVISLGELKAEEKLLIEGLRLFNTKTTEAHAAYLAGHTPRLLTLCLTWKLLCNSLRDRVWTIIRVTNATQAEKGRVRV